jgi:hypothetical protein
MTKCPRTATAVATAFLLPFWLGLTTPAAAAGPAVVRPGESLPRAIERARSAPRPAVIELAAGRHELAEVVRLTPQDNGLTLRGPATGSARVVGSRRVSGWKLVGRARSIWEAPLPAKWGARPVTHVFYDGRRLQRARTPNTGWLETTEKFAQGSPFAMTVPGDVLRPGWAKRGDVYVVCLQKWAGFKLPIRGIDIEKRRVTLPVSPPPHRQEARNRFWIENAPEALDAPGEWYADRTAGVLRVIPPRDGKAVAAAEVTVAALPALLRLEGCAGVTVRNLTFAECGDDFPVESGEIDTQAAAARRGAVQLKGCRDCAIERCVVEEVGGYAIDLARGSRNCSVTRCELRNLGAGGVRVGETRVEQPPSAQVHGHTVADCRVHHYGQAYPGAVGLVVFHASENRLLHNDVHDAPYSGVSVGWTWGYKESPCKANLVEGNHIHHLGGKILSDLGGVYLLGPQPGTTVRRNWIHDLRCFDYGAWGLYTDEGSTGITLEQNVVVRCEKAGFHQHYGRDNVVRGNLIAHCGEGSVRRSREEDHLSFRFAGNVVVSDTPRLLGGSFKNGRYAFERNLYFTPAPDKATWGGLDWARWQGKGQDKGSLVADPLLLDPAHPERGFKPGSPVKRIGFETPDVRAIGVRLSCPVTPAP